VLQNSGVPMHVGAFMKVIGCGGDVLFGLWIHYLVKLEKNSRCAGQRLCWCGLMLSKSFLVVHTWGCPAKSTSVDSVGNFV